MFTLKFYFITLQNSFKQPENDFNDTDLFETPTKAPSYSVAGDRSVVRGSVC